MKKSYNGIKVFLEISSYLTGFSRVELEGTGMLKAYYELVTDTVRPSSAQTHPTNAELFLAESARIIKKGRRNEARINEEIASHLMPNAAYNGLAKQIINLWYNGTWGPNVVSSASYVQGLIWDVAEAHPPGAKQPGYGSWAIPPIKVDA
jgi:hypothetical protein